MDLGLDSEMQESAPAQPAKRAAVGSHGRDMEKLTELLAKMALSQAMQLKVIKSIVIEVVLLPSNCGAFELMARNTKGHQDKVRTAPAQRKALGAPHTHAWNGLIEFMQGVAKGLGDAGKEHMRAFESYFEHVKGSSMGQVPQLLQEVRYCRGNKCWDRSRLRLEVSTTFGTPSQALWTGTVKGLLISKCEGDERAGIAPQTDMEKRVQAMIDDLWPSAGGSRGSGS